MTQCSSFLIIFKCNEQAKGNNKDELDNDGWYLSATYYLAYHSKHISRHNLGFLAVFGVFGMDLDIRRVHKTYARKDKA
jgi:hypothetical protein